jgi:hypothetical protein
LQPLAPIPSHSQPLATRSHSPQSLAAIRSHSQPLATYSHSSGCTWPLKWPQAAAPGNSKRVAASGR